MSNELTIIAPQTLDESERLSTTLGKSALLPDALRGKPADILATILAGAELGLAPMQSLRGIVIIKGKPTLSADTMAALCRRRSDVCERLTLVTSTPELATYETVRRGDPTPTRMSFSMQDATKAGLAGSDTYRKFPSAMLRARALSAICRAVYSDLVLGVYDPDELAEPRVTVDPSPRPTIIEQARKPAPVVETQFTPAASPPKAAPSDPLAVEVEALRSAIAAADTKEALDALRKRLSALPEREKTALRYDYGQRAEALKGEVTT